MATTTKMITGPQLAKLHCTLSQLGLIDCKKELIREFTSGRTESSKDLSMDEARNLIGQLCANEPRQRHIKAIWSLAHTAGIIWDNDAESNRINAAKLNLFLRQRGAVKKDLDKLTLEDAVKVHRQFEGIVKNNAKTIDNRLAKEATEKLLGELKIPIQSK